MFCSCSIESMQFTSRFVWICSGGSCVSKRKRTREMVVGVTYLELGFALLPREGRLSKLRMEATYLSWEYEELAKGCVCVCVCVCVCAHARCQCGRERRTPPAPRLTKMRVSTSVSSSRSESILRPHVRFLVFPPRVSSNRNHSSQHKTGSFAPRFSTHNVAGS